MKRDGVAFLPMVKPFAVVRSVEQLKAQE